MDLILTFVADHLSWLWRGGRFQITDSRADRSNGGDGLLVVESEGLRIRFTCDRRQLMADVQPVQDPADWYSIDLLRRLWTGRPESSALLDASYARFLQLHLDEIEDLVAGEEWPAARDRLRELRVQRSKELFG